VVHGRTKEDGYKAERINWQAIGEIRKRLTIPVIANGEIWDYERAGMSERDGLRCGDDWPRCAERAQPQPVVKYNEPRMPWADVVTLLQKYSRLEKQGDTGLYVARIKQWLSYLRKEYSEALGLFQEIRTLQTSVILRGSFSQNN
jgi:tRNA-dihydrouridine synthase C